MFVYSGKCRLCETGIQTKRKDLYDNDLYTGDIVVIFKVDDNMLLEMSGNLSVVVKDDYSTSWDGKETRHVKNGQEGEPFVMGIKSEWHGDPEGRYERMGGNWRVWKVKDHSDVIDGEHWKAYGFNYRKD